MSKSDSTNWISLADMMTGLMLVFLFISILNMSQIQSVAQDYKNIKSNLHNELDKAFQDKYNDWQMVLEEDLTIKFNDPDVLFGYLDSNLTPRYRKILDEFIPIYFGIINKEIYFNSIKEIRIEGHTADWPDYGYSIKLSQERSNSVLLYFLSSSYFKNLPEPDKAKLKFWISSNGLGLGRALDKDGNWSYESKNPIAASSRRVEFKVVTNSENVIEEILNINKEN